MKKRFLSALLAASVLSGTAGAVFADIDDSYTQQAASALAAVGIVSGTGQGLFEPNRLLSRAEFTKLAVSAMGISNVDNYSSYTIFPDVPTGHWAAGWVNAAIRHPDFTAEDGPTHGAIIHGLSDGTFGPSKPITLGEGCTMVLRMLGYTAEEIGPFWPNDYVAKARALGLLNNVPVTNPGEALTRGNAAVLFRNTLTAQNKEGASMLTLLSGDPPVEGSILIATSETDSSLTASQASFYEGGEELVIRQVVGTLDPLSIGSQGIVIFDKTLKDHVRGFIPDQTTSRNLTLQKVEPEGLLGDDGAGFVSVPRDTPLVFEGKIYNYDESWFELTEGDIITVHYDENGIIQLISSGSQHLNNPIIIMGINGTSDSVPAQWKIVKNGKQIKKRDLKQYDVLTLDADEKTVLVCSNRITGTFDEATPSFRYPEEITVLGTKFRIPSEFSTSFKGMQPQERVTLLFDVYGRICGVVNDPRAEVTMEGVITTCTESSATIQLFNNVSISGEVASHLVMNEDGIYEEEQGVARPLVGQQVRVTQDKEDGKLHLKRLNNLVTENIGNWNIESGKLGGLTVSPDVQVYEQVGQLTPLKQIRVEDIETDVVPSSEILSFRKDSVGAVVSIVLRDVTGENWIYGMADDISIEIPMETKIDPVTGEEYITDVTYDYRVRLTTLVDGESKTIDFLLNHSLGRQQRHNIILGLPASALDNQARLTLTAKVPEKLGTVGLDAFDGYSAVQARQGYYPIADDVPVYCKKTKKCITLREAKASYSSFELYVDGELSEGGKVCIIVV